VPCTYWKHRQARFTVLFSHGNAEDIGQMNDWLAYLSQTLRVSVISYDYRGYGLHQGIPSEGSCFADIEAVYGFLTTEEKIPPNKILLLGRSIGSGPTCYLGHLLSTQARARLNRSWWGMPSFFCSTGTLTRDDNEHLAASDMLPSGFILQSPIASCIRVVSNTLAMLPAVDIFVNVSRIGKIDIPTLIVHGSHDEVVPYAHGAELFAKAATPYKLVTLEGAGHNNIECDYMDEFLAALNEFIEHLLKQASTHEEADE